MSDDYYVYAGYYKKELMYIGKGEKTRHFHLNTGISHVYEANRLHFLGGSLDIKILHNKLTEDSAIELEKIEIANRNPKWNIVYTKENTTIKAMKEANNVINQIKAMVYTVRCKKIYKYSNELIDLVKQIRNIQKYNSFMTLVACNEFNIAGSMLYNTLYISKIFKSMPSHINEIFTLEKKQLPTYKYEVWCIIFNEELLEKYYGK